jgi:hypothetical protein
VSQAEARAEAIRRAKAALTASVEGRAEALELRCARLGLGAPDGREIAFSLFGAPARLDLATLDLSGAEGERRSQTDEILFYHYLEYEGALPAEPLTAGKASSGGLISFRDFPGGAFYWEPFRSRTCLPLEKRFGSGLGGLRAALDRFEWEELELGDLGARVRGFGGLYLTLVAWAAEEGIEAEVNVLFDPVLKRVYAAEDAAAFASRICLGLL